MSAVGENPEIPGAYVLDIVELCGRMGVSAEALLAGTGLSRESLRDPKARVPVPVCAVIAERAHALTREPALALYVGMQMRLSSHGFLGFAAMTAATVRDSLALAVQFAATRTTALGLAFYVEGDTASLVIEERVPLGTLREFAVLSLMVGLWQIGNELTGRTLVGAAEVAFPEPPWIARLPVDTPGGIIRFDQPAHRLVFPASQLDVPLRTADPIALQLARAQCERELAALVDAGFPGRVRAALGRPGPGFPALGEVARQLGVSTRTLKRKLSGHGTSFSAILDDVRRHRALLLLDNRELSVGEVATRLGYTEVPNFTRAFKRWTGKTPAAYRGR